MTTKNIQNLHKFYELMFSTKDIRDKILDPFFTTKSDSTGIGLSLCHRIINDHGGSLTVSDSDLGGAEFRIEIPIIA